MGMAGEGNAAIEREGEGPQPWDDQRKISLLRENSKNFVLAFFQSPYYTEQVKEALK